MANGCRAGVCGTTMCLPFGLDGERLFGGRLRSGAGRSGTGKFALAHAVTEIDDHAEQEPDEETKPGFEWQEQHERERRKRPQRTYDPNPRRFETPREVRLAYAQDEHPDRDDHEGQECANVTEVSRIPDRQNTTKDCHDDSGDNGDYPRGLETWMDPAHKLRQEAVPGHGPEDAGLTEHHDQDYRRKTRNRAELDDARQPGHLRVVGSGGDGVRHVELGVRSDSGCNTGYENVEHGTND